MATWGVSTDRKLMSDTVFAALKRNYPELTIEKFKTELVDFGNLIVCHGFGRIDQESERSGRIEAGEEIEDWNVKCSFTYRDRQACHLKR